jgi:hypothetical protein
MSPLNRTILNASSVLIGPTIIAGFITIATANSFNVPLSSAHWWLFGFIWLPLFIAFGLGNAIHSRK